MIIYAINISSGGGKVLLDELISRSTFGKVHYLFLDSRYSPPKELDQSIDVILIKPRLFHRLIAELKLRKTCDANPNLDLLSFGNLPPFFKQKSKVIVYLQNAFLLPGAPIPRDGWRPIARNFYERLIWFLFKKNINEVWVQTPWMSSKIPKSILCFVRPILPQLPNLKSKETKNIKFLCVTGTNYHKNLVPFLKILLSKKIEDISLYIVIDNLLNNSNLLKTLDQCQKVWPSFRFVTSLERAELFELYQRAHYLVNTSDIESFCLPIYEALNFRLQVISLKRGFSDHLSLSYRFEKLPELVDFICSLDKN